jgi:type I restriction enzyme S subunit
LIVKWRIGHFKAICNKHVAQAGINKKDILNFQFPLPSLPEQRKIAVILANIDEAIQKTDEIISAAQRLKQGLMQTLLTKGIGHTKFTKTEVGEIPADWRVVEFKRVIQKGPQNGLYLPQKAYGRGHKMVHMTELFKADILDTGEMPLVTVDGGIRKKYSLMQGDLIFGRRSFVKEGAGKCVIVPEVNEPILFESSIIRTTINREIAEPLFILYYFLSYYGRVQMDRIIRKVAVSGITGQDLKGVLVMLPKIEEQRRILTLLATLDKQIQKEREKRDQIVRLKNGLMQVLLTGKVRVKVDKSKKEAVA